MIGALEILFVSMFIVAGLTIWSCLILANWADSRLDEFLLTHESLISNPQNFQADEIVQSKT